MDQEIINDLHDDAVDLAFNHFDDPTNEHVKTIYDRLVFNYQLGLGDEGSTTVH